MSTLYAKRHRRGIFQLVLVFCILAFGIGITGYRYYENQKRQIKSDIHDELRAVAELKVNEISRWRKERLGDASTIIENFIIGREIQKWLQDPGESTLNEEILIWMESLRAHYDYDDVLLTDAEGRVLLSIPEGRRADAELLDCLSQSIRLKAPLLSELYRSETDSALRLSLAAPIIDRSEQNAPVAAVLIFRIDPYKFLYPLIQLWPTSSHTAESLLVRREGNEVVFLNELRHWDGLALSLRLPVDREQLPAAMAARGLEGVVEGLDYRGMPVMAAIRSIPDSPWLLVAKEDEDEVYEPIRRYAWITVIMVGTMIAGAGVGLAFIWMSQHAKMYRRQQEALQEVKGELERRVEERTAELVTANEHLKQGIEERELAKRIALEKSRILEAFFSHSITPLVFLDRDFNFIRVNEPYAKACKRASSDFPDHNYFEFYSSEAKPIFEQVVESKELFQVMARPFVFPEHPEWGVTYWDWSLVPILDSNEEVEFLVLSLNDVTARKRAEEALGIYVKKLEWSNRELQDFAAVASHDLQEPLRKIQTFGDHLSINYADRLGDDGCDYLRRMIRASNRMRTFIHDLLNYSRVATKAEPFSPVDLTEVVSEVLSDLEISREKTKGIIEVGDLLAIEADARQMHQLFQNLISNALKFHGEEKPVVKVHGSMTDDDRAYRIMVEDNGIGFDEKYLDRIFGPFQRLHGRDAYEGNGMGLAICRKIVERHGGSITAESSPGNGAKFIVTLPVKQSLGELPGA